MMLASASWFPHINKNMYFYSGEPTFTIHLYQSREVVLHPGDVVEFEIDPYDIPMINRLMSFKKYGLSVSLGGIHNESKS